MPWLVSRHSWQRFLSAISRHSWLGSAVGSGGCSSPLLAEGPGCGSPPLLAGVRWRRWCVVACHSRLRVPVAVPRHSWLGGLLVAVLGGPLPLLAVGLGGGKEGPYQDWPLLYPFHTSPHGPAPHQALHHKKLVKIAPSSRSLAAPSTIQIQIHTAGFRSTHRLSHGGGHVQDLHQKGKP